MEDRVSRRVNVSKAGTEAFASVGARKAWNTLGLRIDPGNSARLRDMYSIEGGQGAIAEIIPGVALAPKKSRSAQKKRSGFVGRLFRS